MRNARWVGIVVALAGMGGIGFLAGERAATPRADLRRDASAPADAARRASSALPAHARPASAIAPGPGMPAPVAALPPLEAPVAAILEDLKKQATAGNSQAACRLAFELDRCHNIARMQRGAASFANLATQPGMGPDLAKRYTAVAEREQARVLEVQRLCVAVSKEESGEAWRYLLQAARAGHGPSMARFANRRTLWEEDPIRVLDGLIAFRAEGPAFLSGAAQMGYPEAYEQLAFAHVNGATLGLDIPVDRVRGLAYYLALMRAGTPEEVARLQRAVDYAMQKENLSQEDLARARVLAEPLAAQLLRRNPPGSVDFTGGTFSNDNGSHCEK
jgi:hypothetical protein